MAAAGYLPEDFEADEVELWPENQVAFDLFFSVRTQWRHGFSGPTGLDYMPLLRLMDDMELQGAARREMLQDITVMELAALQAMHKD